MSIIRRKRQDGFAIVPNTVANDERLSFEERGLLVYLLAKPADWEVRVVDLQRQGGIGRDKAYKLLKGLIAAGYVRRERQLDPDTKRVTSYDYTVSDVADLSKEPLPENQETDSKPLPDLPDTENQDTYKEQKKTKTYSPLSPPKAFGRQSRRRRQRQRELPIESTQTTQSLPEKIKVSSVEEQHLFRRCEQLVGKEGLRDKSGKNWWFSPDVVEQARREVVQ